MPPSQSSGYSQTVQSAVHNSLSSGAAGGGTSASAQIAMLEDLRAYLGMFQERLIGFSENYQRKVDALDGSLLSEVHRRFVEEELEPARIIMANLGDLILDSSIPAVNRRIEQLEPLAQ